MFRDWLTIAIVGALVGSSPSAASSRDCPPERTKSPWSDKEFKHVEGDFWAEVYLELNDRGNVKRCYLGKNNMSSPELRSKTCRSFVNGWTDKSPKKEVMADGKVKRFLRILGDKHIAMLKEARKQWLLENPSERAECHPF